MRYNNHILLIPSWYPNRNNPTHGLFNKVFASAAALHNKVSVLHVCSDEHMRQNIEIVESTENNIHTCTVYYKKIKNPLPGVSQFLKRNQMIRGFEAGYQRVINLFGKPDLIQLNVVMPAGIGATYLSEKYKIPYIVNEGWSGYYAEDGNYKGILLAHFTKKIIKGAKVIMPVSEGLKLAMLRHRLAGKYVVVPNAVDETLFTPTRKKPTGTTRLLHVSSLNETEKNVSGIIRAFATAAKIHQDLELNIVGEGENLLNLESLAKNLGVDHKIRFKGRLMGNELVAEINANDGLIMFSNYETFGITLIEALACEKPVITALSGGVSNLITPALGFVVNPKDESALTEKIIAFTVSKNEFDGPGLRKFVTDRFTVSRIGSQLSDIYATVLSEQIP